MSKDYTKDIKYIEYKPRWKWFRPPFCRLFRWAYHITKEMIFFDCVPVGCGGTKINGEDQEPIAFNVMPPPKFMTDSADSEIRRVYNEWLKEVRDCQ